MNPDVTQLLNALEQGDPHAAEELLPLVYQELRKLAAQRRARVLAFSGEFQSASGYSETQPFGPTADDR